MRNFANKIWNASRFLMMNLTVEDCTLPPLEELELEDKWVLSRLNKLIRDVTANLDSYELGVASANVYDFIWDTYCDWYIELTKTRLTGEDTRSKENAQRVLCYVWEQVLAMLHPFMPFITEEIWQALPHQGDFLMTSQWPEAKPEFDFAAEESAMEAVMAAINAVRSRRSEMNVPPSRKAAMILVTETPDIYTQGAHFIKRLASVSELKVTASAPESTEGMVTLATANAAIYMPLADLVDIAKELERLEKEKAKAEQGLARIEAKLSNAGFVSKAPANVVEGQRQQAEKYRALIANLEESMAQMQG